MVTMQFLKLLKTLRYAERFGGVSTDGSTYITDCTASGTTRYRYISVSSYDRIRDEVVTTTIDAACVSGGAPVGPTANFTQTAMNAGGSQVVPPRQWVNTKYLNVGDCYFTCYQQTNVVPQTIGVFLKLSQVNALGLDENDGGIDFQTSVTFRNLNL